MNSRRRWSTGIALGLTAVLGAAPAGANRIERTVAAAFAGSAGLESIYEGNRQKNFLVRELRTSEERVYISFMIRPAADFQVLGGKLNDLMQLRQNGRKKPVLQASLRSTPDGFRLQFRVGNGKKRPRLIKRVSDKMLLPGGEWTEVTIHWIAATGPGLDDGSVTVWRNGGAPFAIKNDLDNDDQSIEVIRVGQVTTAKSGWFGSIHIDQLLIRRRP